MNRLYTYVLCLITIGLSASFLASCGNWDLPAKKTQRDCEKPNGTITAVAQQKKVDFSITGSSGTIDKVIWDFGDGTTKTTAELVISYTYAASKTYTVKATLANACGPTRETILQRDIAVSDAVLAMVTLQAISGISTNSATSGMTITSTGNATITRYGICWSSTNQIPVIEKDNVADKKEAGAVNAAFSFSLPNLLPNTLYYVRSFAVNTAGTGYSSPVQTFKTGQNPKVSTSDATAVGTASATANFVVNDPGNPIATEFGICYSSTINTPDINNSTPVKVASPPTNANVPVALSNLTPNKTYYYRSYAKTASGEVIYGEVKSFTTQPEIVSQDLIASVSFTDGSLQDVSGYGNHVKLVGTSFTADRTGRPNSAIMLNGTGDYFFMPDNSSLNQTDALSISVWIKPGSFAGRTEDYNKRMQIYNKSKFETGENEMYSSQIKLVGDVGPDVEFITDIKQGSNCQVGKGWQDASFVKPVEFDKWYHLVFTYSGQTVRMYFNNLLVKTLNTPGSKIDNCPGGELKFGAQTKNYNLPWYFKGAMDDIRIYKRALTSAEVEILSKQ